MRPRGAPKQLLFTNAGPLSGSAYPEKSGTIKTDISCDSGWVPLTQARLLSVTSVSQDDTWSALRFRFRDGIKKLPRKNA